MISNEKYTKITGILLFCLVVLAITSSIVIPKFNLFTKSEKTSSNAAQSVNSSIGEVKAAATAPASTGGLCIPGKVCDYKAEIAYQPVCSVNDASIDLAEGGSPNDGKKFVSVRKNSIVEPFIITVPQVLLQGSKYVDDSKKQISKDFPVYRDSQHIILDDEARRTCAPGVDCAEFDVFSKKGDEPFSVHAFTEVKNADEGGTGGDGKAVIYSDPKLKSACPKVQKAKANPKKSGQYSKLLDVKQQPPGDHQTGRNFGATDCYRQNPSGTILNEAKNFQSCVTDVKPTDFVVSAVFEIKQWLECLVGKADCSESKVFAIRLDALYGGVMKCAKPDCEIRYFDYQKLQSIAPGDSLSQIPSFIDPNTVNVLTPVTNPYYIQTPCKIRINKKKIEKVPCLWDISPYQRHYEIQKAAYMPGDPTMQPTFDDYWNNYVMPELQKRSVSCI